MLGSHRPSKAEDASRVRVRSRAEVNPSKERVHGVSIARAVETLERLLDGPLTAIPLDFKVARRAAEIRARHYHRSSRPISLAGAVLLGSAALGDRMATANPDVLAVAEAEKLEAVCAPRAGLTAPSTAD
jgi:hypothetical protein